MLTICECELQKLDLVINAKKSSCIRIGSRNDVTCASICSSSGVLLPWINEMKYLGVTFTSSRIFKISTEHSRRAFHPVANAIFGCVGRVATEEVVLQLLLSNSKCVPILLYGLEACPLES